MGLTRYRPWRRKGSPGNPFVDRIGLLSTRLTLVVGERIPAERVAESVAAADGDARVWAPAGDGAEAGSSRPLAEALVGIEQAVEADAPAELVLADDSDAALAAVLFATKLPIPVSAVAEATASESVNAGLIAQLAPTYNPPR
jgi:hypothetical protein